MSDRPQSSTTSTSQTPPFPVSPSQTHLVPGYPALAGKMGQYMQLGIIRGFWGLAARLLLYYQAHLTTLEWELVALENQDARSPENRKAFAGDWQELSGAAHPDDEQWKKVQEIRTVVNEYCV